MWYVTTVRVATDTLSAPSLPARGRCQVIKCSFILWASSSSCCPSKKEATRTFEEPTPQLACGDSGPPGDGGYMHPHKKKMVKNYDKCCHIPWYCYGTALLVVRYTHIIPSPNPHSSWTRFRCLQFATRNPSLWTVPIHAPITMVPVCARTATVYPRKDHTGYSQALRCGSALIRFPATQQGDLISVTRKISTPCTNVRS